MICKIALASLFNFKEVDKIYQILKLLFLYLVSTNQVEKKETYILLAAEIEFNKDPICEKYVNANNIEYLFEKDAQLPHNTIYESSPLYQRGISEYTRLIDNIQVNTNLDSFIRLVLKKICGLLTYVDSTITL